jgi:glucose-1-phosphate thymidylyltransferase
MSDTQRPADTPTPPKGILLAGGRGTRLYPLTAVACKQLLPVHNKPMVYYPLTTLILAGVREILLISTPEDTPRFQELLGDGSQWGIDLTYKVQPEPRGIAQALTLGASFIGDDRVMLMLGDNLIYGEFSYLRDAVAQTHTGACIFGYLVADPSAYGVVEFDDDYRVLSLEEKPAAPRSNWAVPGVYLYGPGVAEEAAKLTPSARGELEITDLHRRYLEAGRLNVVPMGRGIAWFDTGTPQGLLDASMFVSAIEERQGLAIGCPEEAALRMGNLTEARLRSIVAKMPDSPYRDYVERTAASLRRR